MVLLIGKNGCDACTDAKSILKFKKIDFDFVELNSLPSEKRKFYMDKARENNNLGLPIVFRDDENITVHDLY